VNDTPTHIYEFGPFRVDPRKRLLLHSGNQVRLPTKAFEILLVLLANGKEMEGLAFVAQDLGAKAVVASLWPVADVGTEVLMREFYRLKRANPQWAKAEALRQAQIAMLKGQDTNHKQASGERRGIKIANEIEGGMKGYQRDAKARFGHPHYWAPFILIGNWK
jgi:CHAT domain-containing protein